MHAIRSEWRYTLAALLMLGAAHGARAESVYKCRAADGLIAYQDRPCATTQRETRIEIAAPPPAAPSPDYRVATPAHASTRGPRQPAHRGERTVQSYECRAANGEVFYRHASCPKTIPVQAAAAASGKRRGKGGKGSETVGVTAQALSRAEACRRLAAGAAGRRGHEHDEQVTTYERNAGRDPCRKS